MHMYIDLLAYATHALSPWLIESRTYDAGPPVINHYLLSVVMSILSEL